MKIYPALIAIALLTSCGNNSITGSWVQPIPGQETQEQGFTLKKNGQARSINMHTLIYESWSRDGNMLILTGKSIGNGITIPFSDTLSIEKLTSDELVLKTGKQDMHYTKKKK